MLKAIVKVGAVIICSAIIVAFAYYKLRDAGEIVREEVVIETGSDIEITDFFDNCPADAGFVTDVSGIDTKEPAVYKLRVSYGRNSEKVEKDVILKIEDHTAPEGVAVPQSLYTNWKMPEAKACVDKLYDLSGIASVEYQNGTPEFKKTGTFDVPVSVTDLYGNSAVIMVPFSVIDDHTAPVIKGTHDFEIGEDPHEIDLFKGVTVTDNCDDKPVLKVDDSRVNYYKSGEYTIIYNAIDKAGNIGTAKVKIRVNIPGDDAEDSADEEEDMEGLYYYYTNHGDEAYGLAENILADLWGSNDVETAWAIFDWVHSNISYMTINYYQSYEAAAFRGFASRNGDCYVYCCCCKMLLDLAGIPNMTVTRYPVADNGHFWNLVKLNGEWYHCDATRFLYHPEMFFMCTDDEIDDYRHQYDGYQYPKRAGGSSRYMASATPTPVPSQNSAVAATPTPKPSATPTPVPEPSATPTPVPADNPSDSPTPVPTDAPVPTEEILPDPTEEPDPVPPEDPLVEPADPVSADKPDRPSEITPAGPGAGIGI